MPTHPDLALLRQRVRTALGAEWPTAAAGPLVGWTFELRDAGDPLVRVQHLGAPVGAAGESLLSGRLTAASVSA